MGKQLLSRPFMKKKAANFPSNNSSILPNSTHYMLLASYACHGLKCNFALFYSEYLIVYMLDCKHL